MDGAFVPKVMQKSPITYEAGRRMEKDLLGEREVPADAYYGVQTLRAIECYNITGIRIRNFPEFIIALAQVKKACAKANYKLGHLDREKADAICHACDELIDPECSALGDNKGEQMRQNFLVDMVQGGAGTSTNMNANEVIANRALEHLGKQKGQYEFCHPNDDVNKGQSTNDAYPSAAKIALIHMHEELLQAIDRLSKSFFEKGHEFADVIKMGRTQLQDAVPMTLGQEFNAYGTTIRYDLESVKNAVSRFTGTNLGGTAIGTGIAADKHFSQVVVQELREVTGFPMVLADDLIEASSSVGAMLFFSGILRRVAVKVSKVCNDLRLLASGPRCGLGEINLPPMAPGSSIMPGKVNPVIPEVMNMCCFDTIGNDITVAFGSEAGQLELNVMEPVIIYKLFTSVKVLTRGMNTLREMCINGITANRQRCHDMVHNSIGIVTALLPHIGYKKCTEAAARALKDNKPVADIVVELGYLDRAKVEEYLQPEAMCGPTAKRRRV
jgi:aspartate ammonia-lyase